MNELGTAEQTLVSLLAMSRFPVTVEHITTAMGTWAITDDFFILGTGHCLSSMTGTWADRFL